MDEFLAVLCVLSIVVAIVTVVGHLLWLAAAWCVRTLSGQTGDPSLPAAANRGTPQRAFPTAPEPQRAFTAHEREVPTAPVEPTLRDELKTTARQLRRFLDRGAISQQQYDELTDVIRADFQRLSGETVRERQSMAPAPLETPLPATAGQASSGTQAPAVASHAGDVVDAEIVEPPPISSVPMGDEYTLAPVSSVANAGSPFASRPIAAPTAPLPPPTPAEPVAKLSDMLHSFMEESNIRWGEILAALLIVVSSIGLVVSIQSAYRIPYFPAIVFTIFTLAFYGAGMYTLRRWNLQAVSRVILIISLLLVPLSFSAAVVMSGSGESQRPLTDPLLLAALAIGTAVFGWLTYSASRELVGPAAWWLAPGVLGCSLAQVVIQRANVPALGFWSLNAVAAVPLVGFLIAAVGQLVRSARWPQLSERRIAEILLVLGIAAFAFVAPLALLIVRSDARQLAASHLSPALSLAAAAILALGMLIHRRTTARHLAVYQTVGTGILVCGGVLLLILVGFAWPQPELLLAVGLLNGVVLAALGVLAGLPVLYLPAVACLALAATIGLHLAHGHFEDRTGLAQKIIEAALMGRTTLVLTALAITVAALGGLADRLRRRDDALMLFAATGGLAALAVIVALFSGFIAVPSWQQDRDLAALVLLGYGAACIAVAPFTPWRATAAAGSALVGIGLLQAALYNTVVRGWRADFVLWPEDLVAIAALLHAVLTGIVAFAAVARSVAGSRTEFEAAQMTPRHRLLADPLAVGAVVSLILAVPLLVWVRGGYPLHAWLAVGAAVGWALVAAARRWPGAISGMQAMLALAPAIWIAGVCQQRLGGPRWFLTEPHLLAQLLVFALPAIAWSAIRRLTSRREVLRDLLSPPWPAVDQVLLGAAAIGLPLVTLLAALPGVAWELGYDAPPFFLASPAPTASGWLVTPMLGWLALAAVVAALLATLWQRVTFPALAGIGIAAFAAVWLMDEPYATQIAAASAVRWAAGIYAIVWGSVFIARTQLHAGAKRLAWLRWGRSEPYAEHWFCAQPLVLGGFTILAITVAAVLQSAGGVALRGPAAGSIFAAMGPTASYAGPLMAIVAVLLGYAVRERQAAFALGGSAVFQLAVNLAFLLYVSTTAAQPANVRAIEWWQWNAVAAGAYALVWLGLHRWITPPTAAAREQAVADMLWFVQTAVAATASTVLVVWAARSIIARPFAPPVETALLGSLLSYLAVALVLAAMVWKLALGSRSDWSAWIKLGDVVAVLAAGLLALVAASLDSFDPLRTWLSYHTLEIGWLAIAAAACAVVCWKASAATPQVVALIAGLALAVAIRGNLRDPGQPWWSLGAVLGCGAIATVLALVRRSQLYAYAATVIAGLAVVLFWFAPATGPWLQFLFSDSPAPLELLVLTVTAAAGFWLWREIRTQMQRDGASFDPAWLGPRVHVAAAVLLVPLYFLYRLAYFLVQDAPGIFQPTFTYTAYTTTAALATLALGGLVVAMFWDRRGFLAAPLLYAWGGAAWLAALTGFHWHVERFDNRLTLLVLAAAAHAAVAGQLWSYGANLAAWGTKTGIADPVGGLVRISRWLPVVNLLLVGLVSLAALPLTLLQDELAFRTAAALAPAIAAWGALCLAQEGRKEALQLASLLLGGLSAVYLAWAQIDPHNDAALGMTYVFRLLMVLAALTFLYGLALPRWLLTSGSWLAATRKAGYAAGSLAMGTFVVTLVLEAMLYADGKQGDIADVQVAAVAAVLVLLIAGLLSLALLPGRDPLLLSEKWKQAYVYAAQATAALLFAHVYVCRPEWFGGILREYWPFIVMGLAFLGVGAAELFRRWNVRVMAEPFERTGAMLPLLPVLGMWVIGHEAAPSLVLFVAGLLYLALSVMRKSWAAMVAAVTMGNAALWALFHEADLGFTTRPQFWLIPPALSALVAAHLNRRRLPPEALASIRYAATIVIYLSSTSEIFIVGIGRSLWPPMILLALAVAGALAGIVLRVRAFLFLGTTFTLLALVAMVANAAQSIGHIWPWWAFGIGLGIAILVLFGIFEKKKAEMLDLVTRLRKWEA